MRHFARLIYLLPFFFVLPVAHAVDLSGFPPCDAQACESVAAVGKWPESSSRNMRKIEFQGFGVSVPKSAIETRANATFRQFDLDEKRWVSLSIFRRDDMDEFFKASRYTMKDWANIVYTQTPKSKVPETAAEAYAWYSALMTKVIFVGGHMVTQYKKSPMVAYWINQSHSDNDILMIVSNELPNTLLKLEMHGFDQAAILKQISTVTTLK